MFRRIRYYCHFLHSLITMNARLLWGMWKLTKLPQPAVTIFGGSRIKADSKHAKQASDLAKMLVAQGYSIITGGGPGIMEAANYGAMEYLRECNVVHPKECKTLVSAGIGLLRLNVEKENEYIQEHIVMDHFFTRKWLLVRYSEGFIIFPGGFGTLDEFFEIVTLRQADKMQKAPIVLMDSIYWGPIIEWSRNNALKEDLIQEKDLEIFSVVDSVEEACAIINKQCIKEQHNHH